jgi:SPOR domain
MAGYLRTRTVFFAAILSIASLSVSARAENATAALTEASKMMDQGLPVKAIELIDAAMGSGKLPPESSAKALLMRAQAQEKLSKLAFALADYNSALWMEGLSAADKVQAEKGRDRISAKLGVPDASKQAQAEAGTSEAKVQTTPSEERTGGIGSIFSGIFGSSKAKAETQAEQPAQPPAPAPVAAAPAATAKAPAKPVAKAFTVSEPPKSAAPAKVQTAQLKAEKPARAVVAERKQPAAAAPQADASGKFGIQFAAIHSEDSAIAEVQRIAKKYGADLAGRSPAVKILATSDGGTLYKIVAEGYERGEATAICELLKGKNLNCMVVSTR